MNHDCPTGETSQAAGARPSDIVAGPPRCYRRFHAVFMWWCWTVLARGATPRASRLPGGSFPPEARRRGIFGGPAADLGAEPDQRVVLAAGHPFLHRDERVVGDLDVLRAHLGAALGDVAIGRAHV